MAAARGSRLWVVVGVVLALVLTAAAYLLVIAPARAQVASVQTEVDDAAIQENVLRHRLRDLQAASQDMSQLRTQLAAAKAALPATADTSGLLRRVQQVATATGTLVGAVTIAPSEASTVDGVVAVPVTIVLGGPVDGLVAALDELQSDASRLVTVSSSALKENAEVGSTLALTVQVYATAPPAAAAAGGALPAATDPAGTAAGTGAAAGAAAVPPPPTTAS